MSPAPYGDLRSWASADPRMAWLVPLLDESQRILDSDRHGDLPGWRSALEALPSTRHAFDGRPSAPRFGDAHGDPDTLRTSLMKLHPWRKGPLEVAGLFIDAEWRSDWKWNRISEHLDLRDHVVLDVGCGNGYFGWRMLSAGARRVIGVDPTLVFVMQWLACRHFAGPTPNDVLPIGVEQLPPDPAAFDTVLSMGVLYHRKDPVGHLAHLAGLARPGGCIVLETLVLPDGGSGELKPEGRYARMRNVWSIPGVTLLIGWLERAGLEDVRLLDITATTTEEQRSTEWMRFESLDCSLDPDDAGRTIEGYPAPVRAALMASVPR